MRAPLPTDLCETMIPASRDRITIRAREIAKQIRLDAEPVLIPYEKDRRARPGECFANVRTKVAKAGGSVIDGFVIWETPKVMVQAEFHSIWERPGGPLVDITPPLHGGRMVTFVRSIDTIYEGRNVCPYWLPYDDSNTSFQLVELSKRWIQLVYPPGEIQTSHFVMTAEIEAVIRARTLLLAQLGVA